MLLSAWACSKVGPVKSNSRSVSRTVNGMTSSSAQRAGLFGKLRWSCSKVDTRMWLKKYKEKWNNKTQTKIKGKKKIQKKKKKKTKKGFVSVQSEQHKLAIGYTERKARL